MSQFEEDDEYNDDNEFENEFESDDDVEFDSESDDDDDFELEDIVIDDTDDTDDIEETSEPVKKPGRKPTRSKLIGKHSLAHDSIFKGKKINHEEEYDESEYIIKNAGGSLDINEDLLDFEESRDSIQYYRETRLKVEIKKVLEEFTDINFLANRRKPSKSDFNAYFALLIKELVKFGYTRTEIFIELSGYFSDNIWNMFLLLENKYSNIIIAELKEENGFSDMDKINFIE